METLTPRKLKNKLAKQEREIESHKAQKPIKELTITIEWKKSRTWGNCPRAYADILFQDGRRERKDGYYASGYDKESTVIADIFNQFLRYKLYEKRKMKSRINHKETDHPYCVRYYGGDTRPADENGYKSKPYFEGGVGTSCYYDISKFISGNFEHVSSGKTFDVYKYTDNK